MEESVKDDGWEAFFDSYLQERIKEGKAKESCYDVFKNIDEIEADLLNVLFDWAFQCGVEFATTGKNE